MDYEIENHARSGFQSTRFITWKVSDSSALTFPAENENPNYISFLRQLSKDNPTDPNYLAWVEAGNDPDEFWTVELTQEI